MNILKMKHAPKAPDSIGSRLKYEMRKQAVTSTELARRAEVKTSFLYDVISGKSSNPSTVKLARVADCLGISLAYLAGHEPENQPNRNIDDNDWVNVKLLSIKGGNTTPDTTLGKHPYQFSRSWIKNKLASNVEDVRVTFVRGDSMEPTLCQHDIVLVNTSQTMPTPPGIFMLNDGFGLVAKRVEHIGDIDSNMLRIISDNPKYTTQECALDDIRIVGRVIWFSREI